MRIPNRKAIKQDGLRLGVSIDTIRYILRKMDPNNNNYDCLKYPTPFRVAFCQNVSWVYLDGREDWSKLQEVTLERHEELLS